MAKRAKIWGVWVLTGSLEHREPNMAELRNMP